MGRVHVSRRELKRAFHHLRAQSAPELSAPQQGRVAAAAVLLGLYAAECGLKLLLLAERGLHNTQQLADDDLTHNLNDLLLKLGQPARFRHGRAAAPAGVQVSPVEFHELYRYGGLLQPTPERAVQRGLLELFMYIEENAP